MVNKLLVVWCMQHCSLPSRVVFLIQFCFIHLSDSRFSRDNRDISRSMKKSVYLHIPIFRFMLCVILRWYWPGIEKKEKKYLMVCFTCFRQVKNLYLARVWRFPSQSLPTVLYVERGLQNTGEFMCGFFYILKVKWR